MSEGLLGLDGDLYQTVLRSAMDGFWLADRHGRILDVNEGYELMSGYTREELLTMSISDLEVLETPLEISDRMASLVRLGEGRFETKHRAKGGRTFDIENSVRYLPRDGGLFVVFLKDITERKKSDQALRDSEFFFRASQKAASIGSYKLDFTTGRWESSEVLDLIFGISQEYERSVPGWLDLVHPDDKVPMDRYLWDEVIGKRQRFNKEYRVVRISDRQTRWVLGQGEVAFGTQGRPLSLIGTILDITDRKESQVRVASQEALLRKLIDTMPETVWLKDTHGRFLECNHRFEEFAGLPKDQILGKTDFDLLPAELARDFEQTDLRVLSEGQVTSEAELTFKSDGHREFAETIKTPIYDSSGKILGILGISRDISERKRYLELLTKSYDTLSKTFNASPEAISVVAMDDDTYVEVNDSFVRLTGFGRAEILGRTASDLGVWVTGEDRAHYDAEISRTGAVKDYEAKFRVRDGKVLTMLMNAARIELNGRMSTINFNLDITEAKRLDEERQWLQAQLQQSQKMESLGRLSGGIAHDMNNVLGAILAIAATPLQTLSVDDPTHKALETITKAAIRGGKIVKSLLGFARQTAAEDKLLDVNALLREEQGLLERVTATDIHFVVDLAPDLSPIMGDSDALSNAVMNLCVNSVDAMEDSGTLTLVTRNRGAMVEIQVRDTGSGMSPEVAERAFDPFFTTKPTGKGTGLGLTMVYTTVQAHQGKVEIESSPGKGTTIRMLFPACTPGPKAEGLEAKAAAPSGQRPLEILVVDDDEFILDGMTGMLEFMGHTATLATSGEQALGFIEGGLQPDVVILDMNMPGIGGKGTLPRLRAALPSVPVLLSTGRVDQVALNLAEKIPGTFLLSKPFTVEELSSQLALLHRD